MSTYNEWDIAMNEKMESLIHNQTLDLVELPKCKNDLTNKWVYRFKDEMGR